AFFFQAEDGIRDDLVTGVQTCALPISDGGAAPGRACGGDARRGGEGRRDAWARRPPGLHAARRSQGRRRGRARGRRRGPRSDRRSEERRVGKEWGSRWWPSRYRKEECR